MRNTVISLLGLSLLVSVLAVSTYRPRVSKAQALKHPGKGRVLSPGKGQSLMAHSTTTISWQLDDPGALESVDLLLSMDGGTTFERLASEVRPALNHLDWSPSRAHACERA